MNLQLVKARSLPEQIADAIVEGIASGALQPGQRLIELELTRHLSVSRVPLREALKILEAQGILSRAQNRGVRIVDLDDAHIDQLCEARAALETIAARDALANFRAKPERLQRLEAPITLMEDAVRRSDWTGVNKADLAFQNEICLASENEIVITLWQVLARHVLMIFGREILTERGQSQIVQQHRKFIEDLLVARRSALPHLIKQHIMRLRRPRRALTARRRHS
ncbi:MAG: GntR family transcriptional regulator [Hyphomicrobiales bacterium]|nr:GntR family transcriptional regulator [Hyphomicrobiales bacterium]